VFKVVVSQSMKSNVVLRSAVLILLLSSSVGVVRLCAGADLGSPAPDLAIAHWVKGGPVDLKAGRSTNVYVVEFWATWCPPCRTTIPNLTALQQKYKDKGVVIIGVSDEDASAVRPFVESMGTNMNYTVAVDDQMKSWTNYMAAFGQTGIPHAFVVDKKGSIVWHGSPMAGLDQALDQILAGTYNIEVARKTQKIQSLYQQYFMGAIAGQANAELKKVGESLLTEAAASPGVLHQFAHVMLNEPRIANRQVDLALRASKSAYDATGGKHPGAAYTYSQALFDNGKAQEAITIAKQGLTVANEIPIRNLLTSALERYEKAGTGKK
jgi:thiol-disulfide isomerase/thioredoxin